MELSVNQTGHRFDQDFPGSPGRAASEVSNQRSRRAGLITQIVTSRPPGQSKKRQDGLKESIHLVNKKIVEILLGGH